MTINSSKSNSSRRGDFDVANQINTTDCNEVRDYVSQLYVSTYGASESVFKLVAAFGDFGKLFEGKYFGFRACDTLYHDKQHTLDVTLTMARLLNGYERHNPQNPLGAERFLLGIIVALFHDSGYIRTNQDQYAKNGAVYTLTHVTRSGEFLKGYLPSLGMGKHAKLAATLVHFTGYELEIDDLIIDNPKDKIIGQLLGTADLIAQMSDRCYLEKCRDRLYPEFVTCGLAGDNSFRDSPVFKSPEDLLVKTPAFYRNSVSRRLTANFSSAFNYADIHFEGENPYMDYIVRNIQHLEELNDSGDYTKLQRRPPPTLGETEFGKALAAI